MIKIIVSILCFTCLFFGACDDSYYNDGGILEESVGSFDGSTMDYLESLPHIFDTLTTLIKLNHLEAEVNRTGSTFFAPQNYSVYNYLLLRYPDPSTRPKTLAAIPSEDMLAIATAIRNYIIPDQQILRADLSTVYSYASTATGRNARFNLVREDYLGNVNMGASYIIFSVNTSPISTTERFQSAKVVVTDLRTLNGVVHTLESDTHILGFN